MNAACARVADWEVEHNVTLGGMERHVMTLGVARSGQPADAPVERPQSMMGRQARRVDEEMKAAVASAADGLQNNDCCR